MKKINFCFLIVFMLLIAFSFISTKTFAYENKENKEYKVNEHKEVESKSLNGIIIDSMDSNVNIIPSDNDKIIIDFSGKVFCKEDYVPYLDAITKNNNLTISVKRKGKPDFVNGENLTVSNIKLDIYVPKTSTSSLSIKSVSGNVYVKEFNCKLIDTVSGNITIDDYMGTLNAKSTSGNIAVNYKEFSMNTTIKNVSGNSELILPKDSKFKYKLKSVSASVENEFTGEKSEKGKLSGSVNEGTNLLDVYSVSGYIYIRTK